MYISDLQVMLTHWKNATRGVYQDDEKRITNKNSGGERSERRRDGRGDC